MFRSDLGDFVLAKPRHTHATPLVGICSKHWSLSTWGIHVSISYRYPPNALTRDSLYSSMSASSPSTMAKSMKLIQYLLIFASALQINFSKAHGTVSLTFLVSEVQIRFLLNNKQLSEK